MSGENPKGFKGVALVDCELFRKTIGVMLISFVQKEFDQKYGNEKKLFLDFKYFLGIELIIQPQHCMKSLGIRSFSGPYFPAFELNTEIY